MLDALRFLISADNRAGGALDAVKADLRGVAGALAGVEDRARRVGRSMRNIGAGMTATVTAPLAFLARDAVRLYDEQIRAQTLVEQAIRSTGGAAGFAAPELFEMASGLQAITTFGDEEILRGVTSQLLTFTEVTGTEFERAQAAVLDMATLLDGNLQSSAIMVGKALNDPIRGISALAEVGVAFTEEQREMVRAMVEAGDVAQAQGLILSELERQYGGQAAAAANAPLGQWRQLQNAIGDVKEELGAEVVPFLAPLADKVRALIDWFSELSPAVKENIVVFGGLAAAAGPVLLLLGSSILGVTSLARAFVALGTVMLANPVFAAIAAIAAGAALIYANWDAVAGWFAGLWERVKSAFLVGWEAIKTALLDYTPLGLVYENWEAITGFFSDLWARVTADLRGAWTVIKGLFAGEFSLSQVVQAVWRGITTWFEGIWTLVQLGVSAAWDVIKWWFAGIYSFTEIVGTAWDGVASWFDGIWQDVKGSFQQGWDAIKALAEGMIDWMEDVGWRIMEGLAKGIRSAVDYVIVNTIQGINSITAAVEEALGIRSPSRVFAGIGDNVMQGLAVGIERSAGEPLAALDRVAGQLTGQGQDMGSFGGALGGAITSAGDAWNQFADMAANAFSRIGDGWGTVWSTMKQSVLQGLAQIGSQTLTSGFRGLFGALGGALGFGQPPLQGAIGNAVGIIGQTAFPSFAGGGYTGNGPRSGGMDGQGGFPAILHPREGVIDYTTMSAARGGHSGQAVLRIEAPEGFSVAQMGEIEGIAIEVTRSGLRAYDDQMPTRVRDIQADPRAI